MDVVVNAIHVLAACVWVGGTVILVFVGVPYARTLAGEERANAMRALGHGWRIFGWGAMGIAIVTGVQMAVSDGAFDDAPSDFDAVLVAKVAAVCFLVGGAVLHDFVLGPRLARQIRAGEQPTIRRPLIVVGWFNFALTLTVPVLGVVLGHLS